MASVIVHSRRVNIHDQAWTVFDLVDGYSPDNSGDIIVPEGQRQWSWKDKKGIEKQQKLIDSVFYGYPIPSLIFNRKRNKFEIYDGRHRIETLWRYYNDKFAWCGRLYSELCPEDQRVFCERTLPTTTTRNATNEQLADMFIRLNAGVPLKDYDLLWARRDTPLVRAARTLVCTSARLASALGDIDIAYRGDLANWVGLVAGLSTQNAGNMTTSFIRLSGDEGLGLNMHVDEENVRAGVNALCALLEAANEQYPAPVKQRRSLKKIGKLVAFFFHDWFHSDDKTAIHTKWLDILRRLRSQEAPAMAAALTTTGAQNLTFNKIDAVITQVNTYLANGYAPPVLNESSDDDED